MKKFASIVILLFGFVRGECHEKTLNLIWLFDAHYYCEYDWLQEIFSEVSYNLNELIDKNYEIVMDNSIIFIPCPDEEKYQQYFAKFRERGYKYGVVHISDEAYAHRTDFYSGAVFVLRNYWHEQFSQENVRAIPLGYKNEFWRNCSNKQIADAFHRKYTWSFAGQIKKSTRESMASNMRKVPGYFLHEIESFNGPNSLPIGEYRDILLQTLFVPCPMGFTNLDSFRLYEALECGCLPIVEKTPSDYFANLLGKYPFISVNSWEEAPGRIEDLLANPECLEQIRKDCYEWWMNYKSSLKKQIARIVEDAFQ